MTNWQELESKYYMHTIDRIPVTIVRGQGARVWDDSGKEYLDFVGGLAVDCLGHCHPVTINAIAEQARTLMQTSNWYYTTPQLQLEPYPPLPVGFINVSNNDITAVKLATTQKTCAVMLEPIQGEGGVNVPADDYLKAVRGWCNEKGILLILDEVQTGIGRLGTLFGYELYGIEPDIMTLAKGLGGGIPIGALLAKEKASVFTVGDHNSTFGGNPLTSAAAYATVKHIIDNDIAGNAKKVGQYLMKALIILKHKYPFITEVRGCGLLVAIEFDSDIGANALTACLERGLLVNRVKPNALRFIPPLIIGEREVDEAIDILDNALSSISKKVVK